MRPFSPALLRSHALPLTRTPHPHVPPPPPHMTRHTRAHQHHAPRLPLPLIIAVIMIILIERAPYISRAARRTGPCACGMREMVIVRESSQSVPHSRSPPPPTFTPTLLLRTLISSTLTFSLPFRAPLSLSSLSPSSLPLTSLLSLSPLCVTPTPSSIYGISLIIAVCASPHTFLRLAGEWFSTHASCPFPVHARCASCTRAHRVGLWKFPEVQLLLLQTTLSNLLFLYEFWKALTLITQCRLLAYLEVYSSHDTPNMSPHILRSRVMFYGRSDCGG